MIKCRICGKDSPRHIFYCEEHYTCAVCGTRDHLIIGGECLCKNHLEEKIQKQIEDFEGDTDYTDDVTCPHCGYEHGDSWEVTDGEMNCPNCDLKFDVERNVSCTYTTEKVK